MCQVANNMQNVRLFQNSKQELLTNNLLKNSLGLPPDSVPVHDRVGVETDDFLLFGEGAEFVSKSIIISI